VQFLTELRVEQSGGELQTQVHVSFRSNVAALHVVSFGAAVVLGSGGQLMQVEDL
jgi:hypothetical protein